MKLHEICKQEVKRKSNLHPPLCFELFPTLILFFFLSLSLSTLFSSPPPFLLNTWYIFFRFITVLFFSHLFLLLLLLFLPLPFLFLFLFSSHFSPLLSSPLLYSSFLISFFPVNLSIPLFPFLSILVH